MNLVINRELQMLLQYYGINDVITCTSIKDDRWESADFLYIDGVCLREYSPADYAEECAGLHYYAEIIA